MAVLLQCVESDGSQAEKREKGSEPEISPEYLYVKQIVEIDL
jgi:hypothetical protein